MQLSIYSVYEEICGENCILKTHENITFSLSGVRIYTERCENLSSSILYIIYPEQLKNFLPDKSLHFVCIGFVEAEYICEKFHSVILMPGDTDAHFLLSSIQDIFDRYHGWMELINTAILQRKSLQTIFDLCSQFFNNPISLFDSSQSLLLKSGNIPENTEGSIWDFVLKHGYSPKVADGESYYIYTQLQANPMPFYYKSNDQYRNNNRLIAGIHLHNALFGCVALSDINAPISNIEYVNLHYIQQLIESALLNSKEFQSYINETPWYITKLLRGEQVESSVVLYNLSLKGKQAEDKFYLWCFMPLNHTSSDEPSIKCYLPNLSSHFKTDMVFCHENQIVVFDYRLDGYDDNKHFLNLIEFLSFIGFRGAHSMIFNSILETRHAYMQCQITLENTDIKAGSIHSFQKHYSSYIFETLKRNTPLGSILYPGIKQLLIKDKKYGIELLRCLQTYIMQGQNISATAEHLFVHRHTVIYRMNYITKVLEIDFKSLDDSSLFHILLSCNLLLHYEKSNT